jgi:hypothetical protein
MKMDSHLLAMASALLAESAAARALLAAAVALDSHFCWSAAHASCAFAHLSSAALELAQPEIMVKANAITNKTAKILFIPLSSFCFRTSDLVLTHWNRESSSCKPKLHPISKKPFPLTPPLESVT